MDSSLMNRREAIRRATLVLGGALSAATITGVLAGCESSRAAAGGGAAWQPRTLSPEQSEIVAILGEQLIPETETPGARSARVHEFIDAMLTDFYAEPQRKRFLAGLERVDGRARRAFGKPFLESTADQQHQLAEALNQAALSDHRTDTSVSGKLGGEWAPEDVGKKAFFRTLKELVVVGYYTSEPGATRELKQNPMGSWQADVPYARIGSVWA